MATSAVDDTIPADDVKVSKGDLRANFATIKDELNELFRKTSKAWKIANGEESV